jgi:hypothetical protein
VSKERGIPPAWGEEEEGGRSTDWGRLSCCLQGACAAARRPRAGPKYSSSDRRKAPTTVREGAAPQRRGGGGTADQAEAGIEASKQSRGLRWAHCLVLNESGCLSREGSHGSRRSKHCCWPAGRKRGGRAQAAGPASRRLSRRPFVAGSLSCIPFTLRAPSPPRSSTRAPHGPPQVRRPCRARRGGRGRPRSGPSRARTERGGWCASRPSRTSGG